jgi:hypothetical protein
VAVNVLFGVSSLENLPLLESRIAAIRAERTRLIVRLKGTLVLVNYVINR